MARIRNILPRARKTAASPNFTAFLAALAAVLIVIAAAMAAYGPTMTDIASR